MSTKKSQIYLYFQNKAHHYQNLQTVKPKIIDKLDSSINHTIDHLSQSNYNRDFPYNKMYEIEVENTHMTGRLDYIQHNQRRELGVQGNYSRYNSFERSFRLSNRYNQQQQRQKRIKNDKIKAKIKNIKPQIGDHHFWQASYRNNTKLTKSSNKSSKGSLRIDSKPFMAEAYRQFLHQLSRSGSKQDLKTSRSSKGEQNMVSIDHKKLFILPNLTARKNVKLKASKLSIQGSAQEANPPHNDP